MINLIKNEFIKIFSKKSIYIVLIIILGLVIFNNTIYKSMSKNHYSNNYNIDYLNELKDSIQNSGKISPDEYINLKTELDTISIGVEYNKDWMHTVIEQKLYDIIYNMNSLNNESDEYLIYKEKYDVIINAFKEDNWKLIPQYEIDNYDDYTDEELFKSNYRLDNNINYKNDYLNNALEGYKSDFPSYDTFVKSYKSMGKIQNTDVLKEEYNNNLKNNIMNKYIIDSKQDIENSTTNRYLLMNIEEQYSIFILVIIVMISGSIISTEFDKGTIKLLLVKPYSRTKILLSKYIVSLLFILFGIIVVSLMQFIVGGLILGFDSLSIPAVIYNYSTNKVVVMNIFKYMLMTISLGLPKYILLVTLSFAVSSLFTNSVLGVITPIIGSFASMIINTIASGFTIKYMNYFVTLNWDFNQYMFGKKLLYENINLPFSIIICIIYFIIMIIPTFIVFKKKNIKNI